MIISKFIQDLWNEPFFEIELKKCNGFIDILIVKISKFIQNVVLALRQLIY